MKRKSYIVLLFVFDLMLIMSSFVVLAYFRSGTRVIIRDYSRPLITLIMIWTVVSFIFGKYLLKQKKDWRDITANILQTNFVVLSIVIIMIYVFGLLHLSRYMVIGTIGIATVLEIGFFVLICFTFKFRSFRNENGKKTLVTKSPVLEKQQTGKFFRQTDHNTENSEEFYKPQFAEYKPEEAITDEFWYKYFEEQSQLAHFVKKHVDVNRIATDKTLIINSSNIYNIDHFDKNSQQMFVNLHKVNDFPRINKYFIKVNQNLQPGGVFICQGETISQLYHRYMKHYGRIVGFVFYGCNFCFRRIFPKIVLLQGFYFMTTKGRHRSLSETEILGRLFFCGFQIIEYKEIEGKTYFICKKIKLPSNDKNPSYGPLIKLKRIGKNGELFNCYKVRTMHPYSEYLQDYVFSKYSVTSSGKFTDDFRITNWGRFMRNYWIDELPQLINLMKGDVRLIGARALSRQYFEQYPEDLKEMRLKYKPGLIPVYTADKATTLQELIESERKYLKKIGNGNRMMTDSVYLSKAVFNIITGRIRSLDNY